MVCWAQEQSIPAETHFEQGIAVLRTVLAATLTSSWAIWLGAAQKRGLAMTLLRTGFPMQLALNALCHCRLAVASVVEPDFPLNFFCGVQLADIYPRSRTDHCSSSESFAVFVLQVGSSRRYVSEFR
jgi:hypothetical protein